ncbi:MAG TPA: hypothetical protein VGY97_13560 [Solirubrobacteraceae bacterium]|jgi:hypothetical protein|nr:hypothetical protein [Solirubrobacteraceae bacterium]
MTATGPRTSAAGPTGEADGVARPPPARGSVAHPIVTFSRLKWASLTHSCIYLALLYAAFVGGKPEPVTFVLGLAHGLLWIGMSLVCLAAVRARVIPLRVAVAVAVLGGLGPFVGSFEFVREGRRRRR